MSSNRKHRAFAFVFAATTAVACGSTYGDSVEDGAFGGRCFPNGTCLESLVCQQSVCLKADDRDAQATPPDASSFVDAPPKPDVFVFNDGGGPADGSPVLDGSPPACTKKPNLSSCGASSECCSNACAQDLKCRDICEPLDTTCDDAFGSSECCIGTFCAQSFKCRPCIPAGNTPEDLIIGGVNARSCCSGAINGGSNKCL